MDEPRWISRAVVLALHDEQLAEHGGASGLRDPGLLESALDRPRSLFAYGQPDLAALAAAHGFGLIRNHPFVDGNKRVAFVVAETFLALAGQEIAADDAECLSVWLSLAAGEVSEAELAAWLRPRLKPLA
ncbi:type II toxin-antitoxin system death-on-curing family toxin [Inquilinus limosus]|uniref:type II toxin-antitoxin system death-on-curing family toxin n=1 Tax=Inquilinus limosus TaxID=171674 RepID=UPI0004120FA7|nr:type II toxin-antitoxin system death-on-curing family toxin [Inquilinus limosus]